MPSLEDLLAQLDAQGVHVKPVWDPQSQRTTISVRDADLETLSRAQIEALGHYESAILSRYDQQMNAAGVPERYRGEARLSPQASRERKPGPVSALEAGAIGFVDQMRGYMEGIGQLGQERRLSHFEGLREDLLEKAAAEGRDPDPAALADLEGAISRTQEKIGAIRDTRAGQKRQDRAAAKAHPAAHFTGRTFQFFSDPFNLPFFGGGKPVALGLEELVEQGVKKGLRNRTAEMLKSRIAREMGEGALAAAGAEAMRVVPEGDERSVGAMAAAGAGLTGTLNAGGALTRRVVRGPEMTRETQRALSPIAAKYGIELDPTVARRELTGASDTLQELPGAPLRSFKERRLFEEIPAAGEQFKKGFGDVSDPGKVVVENVQKVASARREEGSRLYQALEEKLESLQDSVNRGEKRMPVTLEPLYKEAKQIEKELSKFWGTRRGKISRTLDGDISDIVERHELATSSEKKVRDAVNKTQAPTFMELHLHRSLWLEEARDAADLGDTRLAGYYQRLATAADKALEVSGEKMKGADPEAYKLWREAEDYWREQVVPLQHPEIARIVRSGADAAKSGIDADQVVPLQFAAGREGRQQRLLDVLDDEGKVALKVGIVEQALEGAHRDAAEVGEYLSPAKLATNLRKVMGKQKAAFSDTEIREIEGFTKLMRALGSDTEALVNPKTGNRLVAPIMVALVGYGISESAPQAALYTAAGYGAQWMLTNPYARRILMTLGEEQIGSPRFWAGVNGLRKLARSKLGPRGLVEMQREAGDEPEVYEPGRAGEGPITAQ
jgi:hypothetical protein